jgi:hypothetical protein
MSEQTAEDTSERFLVPEQPQPLVPDGALLGLLVVNGVLLGGFGLVFTPLYANGVPVPMGAVLSILVLPWLVRRAGEIDVRPAVAGAPLTAWVVTVGALGLFGPGGDAMLAANWQSLLLLVGGIGTGLWALRAVLEQQHRERAGVDLRGRSAGSEERTSGHRRSSTEPGRSASRRSEGEALERRRARG